MPLTPTLERRASALLPALGEGNAVVSPFNVATALALLVPGARGGTYEELERLLGPDAPGALARAQRELLDLAETDALAATAAWVSPVLELSSAYRDAIADALDALVSELDFTRPAEAAATINRWVADGTRGRIAELVDANDLDPDSTRLVLTAALFFKAAWEEELRRIGPRPFRLAGGRSEEREFMARRGLFEYADVPGLQAVRIAYADGTTSLEIVVPDDLPALERDLAAKLALTAADMRTADVDLELPLFAVRGSTKLKDELVAAGLPSAFDRDRADLSGISDAECLYVDEVIHEALIEVDEKGTVAAAATAAVIRAVSVTIPTRMVVDRPFLFVLRGPELAPLFVGRVTDPVPPGT